MKKNSTKRIFCIYPVWLNNSGHEASYLETLKYLSKKTSKKLFLILPKKNKNKIKGISYMKILEHLSTGYLSLIIKVFKNFRNINIFFKKKNLNYKDIIFIDGYSFDFLISLSIFLISKKKESNLLIYCRYDFVFIKKILFNFFIFLVSLKFSNYKILTDTNKLYEKLINKYSRKNVILVPVPHTVINLNLEKKSSFKKYDLYFPGQYRNEKFGTNFFNFIKLNDENNYRFIISEKFRYYKKKNFKLKLIKTNLTHKNYINYIKKSQLIILPYSSKLYKFRTSGIFIECVSVAKPMLVTEGTWMASEYKKFNLNELIVKDWSKYNLKSNLKIIFSKKIKVKLLKIQKKYKEFHNMYKYANILENNL